MGLHGIWLRGNGRFQLQRESGGRLQHVHGEDKGERRFGLSVLGEDEGKRAFDFSDSIMCSVRRVVEVLNEVGRSCRTSGVHSLIEMLNSLGSFEMAKFVMEIIERKTGYYNILIKEKCQRRDFEGAKGILDEMRQMGCDPIVNTYNYLLSSLCRSDKTDETCQLLEEMQERNCLPNPLTFEIFIYHSCRLGKFDLAIEFLDRMISNGLDSRNC
ncbi:pentatricopeptide repeat-containing protein At3g04760, chloroplastic-like [Carya illinoinensis]|uniref:pentatricopeptide repeat-containing protein At3g04760, chloroplastic-like n=1 Tax=Carya illinoinensis TaxID=32201 RepID=UPI001C7195EF|nr:pentatricopeptide repeat-containing protein At3g04760, chloroplastic-like [Carya illinoinensis]